MGAQPCRNETVGTMMNMNRTGMVTQTMGPFIASWRLDAVRSTYSRLCARSTLASSMSEPGRSMLPVVAVANSL